MSIMRAWIDYTWMSLMRKEEEGDQVLIELRSQHEDDKCQ
jgi:hypothetical protein